MRFNTGADQAEGLRRLLVRNHVQVVTVVAGKSGVGRTSMTVNLAAAMARSGKEVLVLDENHASNNLLDQLGLYGRYDFLDVAQGRCKPQEAVLNAGDFSVLSCARAMYAMTQLKPSEQHRLESALTEVSDSVDVLLVDTAMLGQARMSSSLASGVSLLVVVDATTSGITESYALIKRMALENACLQFEIVVNKVHDERAALTVFSNMYKVARHNLAARLEYLGYIPQDERLQRATQMGKPVIEAFPRSASAKSCSELSHKLLHLPIQQCEVDGGGRTIIRNLMKQTVHPSKKVAYDVNC